MKQHKFLISGGGTGGHIYPGLAITEYFLAKSQSISWVGTPKGMENTLVDKNKAPWIKW